MLRRRFLALGAGASLALAQKKQDDTIIATATQDSTPRVGIVLSSFKEGEEHDGTKIPGLSDPKPPGADLTSAQLDAWVRKAIDLASLRSKEFGEVVEAEDWVVVKTRIPARGAPASVTDPRIVRTVVSYLAERKRGLRFTVVESAEQANAWDMDWGGAFDGLTYRKMIGDLSARFPGVRFEIADLNSAERLDLPVPGKALARNNPAGVYRVPKIIQQCDRLISIAPLATDAATGVALSLKNYMGIAPQDGLLKLGSPDEIIIDLFSYRPADLALVGGCWGVEGDGARVHHNVLVAGMKAVAVDSVAAAVMGFKPGDLPFLALGEKKGFGAWDIDEIWTRGNDVEEARREFKKPGGWQAPAKK